MKHKRNNDGVFELMTLAELERWAIESSMDRNNDRILAVARELEIGKTTLYRKLKQYGWQRPEETP